MIDLSDTVRPAASGFDAAMAETAPGWYYDPTDEAVYRYWSGTDWTEHSSDLFPTSPPTGN